MTSKTVPVNVAPLVAGRQHVVVVGPADARRDLRDPGAVHQRRLVADQQVFLTLKLAAERLDLVVVGLKSSVGKQQWHIK